MSLPLEPARAAVRPRLAADAGGEPRLLEDLVAELLGAGRRAFVWVEAPERGGKTTALRHLASVFAGDPRLCLRDEGAAAPAAEGVVVTVSARRPGAEEVPGARLRLAAWSHDDCLEYLMHRHPARVGVAFEKWRRARPAHDLAEWPELCAAVLDALVQHEGLPGPAEAADLVVAQEAGDRLEDLRTRALRRQTFRGEEHEAGLGFRMQRLALRSGTVAARLAAACLLEHLEAARPRMWPSPPRWDERFLAELVDLVRADPARRARLEDHARGRKRRMECELLTVLNADRPGYRPPRGDWRGLERAWLPGIDLAGCSLFGRLDGAVLRGASLRAANLTRAGGTGLDLGGADATGLVADGVDLTRSDLRNARLDAASLRGARLVGCELESASLRDADLGLANLQHARLDGAELAGCRLERAMLSGLDLRNVRLGGAILDGALLAGARLEGVDVGNLQAEGANLGGADLTASRLPRARLGRVRLVNAGLAAIDWEGADLRGADLTGATFHLGSSRSGLVASDLASEGTRTGFYTDEALEDSFRAPEDVRKASLRSADLRGATITGVDFYLVDLRGARLDESQLEWARRCKAILDPRR